MAWQFGSLVDTNRNQLSNRYYARIQLIESVTNAVQTIMLKYTTLPTLQQIRDDAKNQIDILNTQRNTTISDAVDIIQELMRRGVSRNAILNKLRELN